MAKSKSTPEVDPATADIEVIASVSLSLRIGPRITEIST